MALTRRDVLLAGSGVPLLAGCGRFGDSSTDVADVTVVLANGQSEPLTFRFALETADGVGKWFSREVGAEERESVTVEPSEGETFVAIRGSVADHSLRDELLSYGDGEACPTVYIEFDLADEPTVLQDTNTSCREQS